MREVHIPFGSMNPLQKRVMDEFKRGARFVAMISGRQGGKSHMGARWLISQTADNDAKNKLALAIAPSYPLAKTIIRKIDEVLKADYRLWERIKFIKQPIPTYTFPNGWEIEVRSVEDPDSVRGPTASRIWQDEAAKSVGEAFDILTPTLLAENGKYLATTTPRGKHNWVYQRIAKKAYGPDHPEHDPDLYNPLYAIVVGSTWDNVENLSEEAVLALEDQYGKTSSFGRQEIYGEFVSFEGLVYHWNEERNYLAFSDMPALEDYSIITGGIDFGWTDPSTAVVLGYKEGVWYVIDGVFEEQLLTEQFIARVAALTAQYGVKLWWADSAAAGSIASMRHAGLPVEPVVKPLIEERIREMAMFTDHDRLKVSYRCNFVKDELQQYQYPEKDRLLRDKRRNPVDKYNHSMDAIGYAIWQNQHLWNNDRRIRIRSPREEVDRDDLVFVKEGRGRKRYTDPAGLVGS